MGQVEKRGRGSGGWVAVGEWLGVSERLQQRSRLAASRQQQRGLPSEQRRQPREGGAGVAWQQQQQRGGAHLQLLVAPPHGIQVLA